MQLQKPFDRPIEFQNASSRLQSLRWFLIPPVTAFVLLSVLLAGALSLYRIQHQDRVFTGVHLNNVELGGMTPAEVEATVTASLPAASKQKVQLVDPRTGQVWEFSGADLGVSYDVEETVDAAINVGREGGLVGAFEHQLHAWTYGYPVWPVLIFDEGQLQSALEEIAAEVNRPARDAQLAFDGESISYTPGQVGRELDITATMERLREPLLRFQPAQAELLIHEKRPRVLDDPDVVQKAERYLSAPMVLYFEEPLVDVDLQRVEVSPGRLAQWLRVAMVEEPDAPAGTPAYRHEVSLDREAVRQWLSEIQAQVYKAPQNARFYFDDATWELVLVEPHIHGRALDVEATLDRFMAQAATPNRSLPFVVEELTPTVHSRATAADLGITELITESTTWFYGSTPERKHNIARAAAQFFGIVVAPGETFSFNDYLGDVTEEAGFTTGLVIIGGRTVEGVGGGVCQVSTTLYQTAFWAGFPIVERWPHGYRVHYYDDGQGPGMDATVYKPDKPEDAWQEADFRFVNNTDHYLLIENYYNETYQSLTFKFYSTRVGRRVVKEGPFFENEEPPRPEVWEYDEDLEEGEIKQMDWAVEGADVTVNRRVYSADGSLLYQDSFFSPYIPWMDVFHYGPGVEPGSSSS
ncbi:MAG: VanW family protein [Candidatus Promineifilaceae bacterium]|nr:VanW family protein [Candidatus Promineifilaceae bacterium]